ncbi:MAG: FHA domain-containing protein [Deltaproteobacteria bacterium]|nr:FHA domain-containing protein [Deltaproteobacteria bacterium]MCX5875328.1 FHA domain-containing protein [Deltaproteobacteria bacterium]
MMQDGTINLEDYTKSDWTIMLNDRVITTFTTHEGSKLIIGRSPDADVVIDNTAISRHHSSIELRDGRHYLADMKSTNGTTVNGKKIVSKVPVTEKDVIFIGKFRLIQAAANEQHASSSYATAMDIDDEATVFVSSPRQQVAAQPSQSKSPSTNEIYRLTVLEGNALPTMLSLDGKSSVKLGKDPSCDMIIPGWLVGKTQCYVVSKKDRYYIVPQRSWTNTRLNDVIIKEERLLRKGDMIQIKSVKIRFN